MDCKCLIQEVIDVIGEGLSWFGLDWIGEVIFQFVQVECYVEVVNVLVECGKVFCCYCMFEEVQELCDQVFVDGWVL